MSPRRTRGTAGVVGALGLLLATAAQAVAGAVLWTMTASPLTATVGTPTTFTLTATNLDPLLGIKCVIADIPSAIAAGDVWLAGSSTTASWVVSRSGQQVIAVIATGDGNQKLTVGAWVAFAVSGVPVQTGSYAIHAVAYSGHECVNGARVLAAPPVILISQALVVPPPPDPTVAPTPAPTPTPQPIIVVPSVLPTLPALTPRNPTPRPAPRATPVAPAVQGAASPEAAPTTVASPAAALATTPGASAASPSPRPLPAGAALDGAGATLAVAPRGEPGEGLGLQLGPMTGIEGVGVWAVPGAVVGGPGLVVIVWVAIQAGVAMAWMPAVRRLRGDGRFGNAARRT